MQAAIYGINNLVLRSKIRNDDSIDQLHHFVTVALFASFAAVSGVMQYAGEPINCWNYGDYTVKHYQDHVNQYCWTHSLYHYPNHTNRSVMPYLLDNLGGPLDPEIELQGEDSGQITFYRWVTVIFLVQALMFKFPNLVWGEYNSYSGSNIVKMVEMLQDVLFTKEDDRKEKLRQVALFLEQWLRIHRKPHSFLKNDASPLVKKTLSYCTLCLGDNKSNYLSNVYLLTKLGFLVNNFLQFLVLSLFLQINFWDFGFKTLSAYAKTVPVQSTQKTFPIVALCHFQTYDKGPTAIGKWVQCILTINIFLEKLFLIEWFWLLILLVLSILNFGHWCSLIFRTKTALNFAHRYIKLMGVYTKRIQMPKSCSEKQFVLEYLRNDGIFILRIFAHNTNEVVIAQLMEELLKRYVTFKEFPQDLEMEEGEELVETSFVDQPNNVRHRVVEPTPPSEPTTV